MSRATSRLPGGARPRPRRRGQRGVDRGIAGPDLRTPSLDALDEALDAGVESFPRPLCMPTPRSKPDVLSSISPLVGDARARPDELAEQRGVPHAGRDGKTGETLVKSALAPMFVTRPAGPLMVGEQISSAAETGRRSRTLTGPRASSSPSSAFSQRSSDTNPTRRSHIDYVPDLGEWKTAWDHVSFEGFLGTRMRMQFTWEGCDSALAAPLVLDLARLGRGRTRAGRAGRVGRPRVLLQGPMGGDEHRLDPQFQRLCDWAQGLKGRRP